MAFARSVRSSIQNSYRKFSKSNTCSLKSIRQCSRPIHTLSNKNNLQNGNKTMNAMHRHSPSVYSLLSSNYRYHSLRSQYSSPYQFYHPLMSQQYGDGPVPIHATTILCVRKNDEVVMIGDGQMTIGNVVAKPNGKKLRKLNNNKAICGFAGAAADGISLVDLLEKKLSERDQLRTAVVETTRMWRTDKILRHLNAILIVADEKSTYQLTGSGELVESDTGIMAIGSGGNFAEAAARALMDDDLGLSATDIATKSMKIAGDMCIYTNHNTIKLVIKQGEGIVEDTTNPAK